MLLYKKSKVNCKYLESRTPLMLACEYGHLEVVRALCRKGADVESLCKAHRTAIMYAIANGYEGLAMWPVSKRNADPLIPNNQHTTAMDLADAFGFAAFKQVYTQHTLTVVQLSDDDEPGDA